MTDTTASPEAGTEQEAAPKHRDGTPGSEPERHPVLVEAELLVEDVSIDGMCGVY